MVNITIPIPDSFTVYDPDRSRFIEFELRNSSYYYEDTSYNVYYSDDTKPDLIYTDELIWNLQQGIFILMKDDTPENRLVMQIKHG